MDRQTDRLKVKCMIECKRGREEWSEEKGGGSDECRREGIS